MLALKCFESKMYRIDLEIINYWAAGQQYKCQAFIYLFIRMIDPAIHYKLASFNENPVRTKLTINNSSSLVVSLLSHHGSTQKRLIERP